MLTKENLNEALADAVMDLPREFHIDGKRFCLWSPTLGMSIMTSRHISELGINDIILKSNPGVEALRITTRYPEKVCYILAINTLRKYRSLSNTNLIKNRANLFLSNLSLNELSGFLISILNELNAETLISLSGIEKQRQIQTQIAEIKNNNGNSLSFGGLTIYGSLIAPAMSQLHMDYYDVVWGISLVNLKMLLADLVNSVYLSDEEAKSLGMTTTKKETYGMTQADIDKLKSMDCWE